MGCWRCLPLSVAQLKGKHCRKPHCHNGVVDTLGCCFILSSFLLVSRNLQSEYLDACFCQLFCMFPCRKWKYSFIDYLENIQTTLILHTVEILRRKQMGGALFFVRKWDFYFSKNVPEREILFLHKSPTGLIYYIHIQALYTIKVLIHKKNSHIFAM